MLNDTLACATVITHGHAIFCRKGFTKELKLHHASTKVRLLTVFKNRVKRMQVLLLPDASTATLTDEEVVELPVSILIVKDTFGFLLITTGSSTFLYVAF